MTFEYFNTKFHLTIWKQKQPFTFWYRIDNFYPWKDIVRKKVSKLRSIAELRAFYGTHKTRQNTMTCSMFFSFHAWFNDLVSFFISNISRQDEAFNLFWCKKWSTAHSLLHNNPGNKGESTLITGRGQGERKTRSPPRKKPWARK